MARRVIGLDLGTYSIKLLRLEASKQNYNFEVLDVVEEILLPIEDENEESDHLLLSQKKALASLQEKGLLDAETYAAGISSIYGHMRSLKVPFKDTRKIDSVLEGILESEVPFELDDMLIAWHQKLLLGVPEENETKLNIALVDKKEILKNLHMLQPIGIDPRILHLNSAALYEIIRELGHELFFYQASLEEKTYEKTLGCFLDIGHTSTNICLFDTNGLVLAKSLFKGGKQLTQKIATQLNIDFLAAQELKHKYATLLSSPTFSDEEVVVRNICKEFYEDLAFDISRIFISCNTDEVGHIGAIALVGGGSNIAGINNFFNEALLDINCKVVDIKSIMPANYSPSFALSLAFAFSCIHLHSKDSRFNLRKAEFAWRGGFEFVKSKSTPLTLWGLTIVCSLTVLYFANSLVIQKEIKSVEDKLSNACFAILGKKNITPQSCLAQMKEQINKNTDLGPTFSSSDFYVKISDAISKAGISVKLNELEVAEKRGKIGGYTETYENIDKIVNAISQIPCFKKIEKTKAVQEKDGIRFQLTNDIECKG